MYPAEASNTTAISVPWRTLSRLSRATTTILQIFETTKVGQIQITTPEGVVVSYGDPSSTLKAHWIVSDQRCFARILREGALGLGESFMDGWWDVKEGKLSHFLGIILVNRLWESVKEHPIVAFRILLEKILASPAGLRRAKRSIQRHYDLGNEFFKLMLDPSMTYSCGYEVETTDTLEQMQQNKYNLICKKLGLAPGGKLLDIGCGWGGMLIHAAKNYGIDGYGITLSEEQRRGALERVAAAGLSDRIKIELVDYRQVQGKFDYLVNIGMFEHVGRAAFGTFMWKMAELLVPDGRGLLHSIGTTDDPNIPADPWTARYIFPGTRLPRLEEITKEMRKARLSPVHIEDLKPHYAETVRRWQDNFEKNRVEISKLGPQFDQRFFRMWNYYLSGCEAGFEFGDLQLYQVLFGKNGGWKFQRNLRFSV